MFASLLVGHSLEFLSDSSRLLFSSMLRPGSASLLYAFFIPCCIVLPWSSLCPRVPQKLDGNTVLPYDMININISARAALSMP
jgi:hypothetical protein